MKRFHAEKSLIKRRKKVAAHYGLGGRKENFRKRHPLDCGNPRCGICCREKRFGHVETRAEQFAAEQLGEYWYKV